MLIYYTPAQRLSIKSCAKARNILTSTGRGCSGYTPRMSRHAHPYLTRDAGADEMLVREYVGHAHTGGFSRILTPSQARYKGRQPDRLRELLGFISSLYT